MRPLFRAVIPADLFLVERILKARDFGLRAAVIPVPYIGIQRICRHFCPADIHGRIFAVTHLSGNDKHPEIVKIIGAGRQRHNLVVFIDRYRTVDDRTHPELIDKFQKIIVTAEIASHIVKIRTVRIQHIGLDDSNDLPLSCFLEGIVGQNRRILIDAEGVIV